MTKEVERLKRIIHKLVFSNMEKGDIPYSLHLNYGVYKLCWRGKAEDMLNEPVDYFLAKIDELS